MTANDVTTGPTAEQLPPAEQERLARILDEYLVAVERGAPITPDELLAQYPADARYLRCYLSGLEIFHAAVHNSQNGSASLLLSDMAIQPGRTIADYTLLREIGRGGMGVVYEALQTSLRRRVALKLLPFSSAHDAKQIGRFKNEAQAAAQVRHPNIVPVYAVGEEHGVHYYAMELIEGQSLTSLLGRLRNDDEASTSEGTTAPNNTLTKYHQRVAAKSPPASRSPILPRAEVVELANTAEHIRRVARLGVQAAEALHAAHEYGVIHRDVKPSNLLLDEYDKLWVTDFGLARCREGANLTQTGDILGTMRYMSPEQALGSSGLVDHRTDVYSLGVTLYELAALRHPADDAGDLQLFFDRTRSNYRPLRHWNRQIPRDFETIVMKAIAEFPHERYTTAQELADDLQRFLDGQPILASRPNLATRTGKWAKRHRGAVYAAAGMVVIAIAALSVGLIVVSAEKAKTDAAVLELTASKKLSEANQQFALQNYKRAREVLDKVGSRIAAQLELEKKPSADSIQRIRFELLTSISDYYQEFIDQAATDPTLDSDNPLLKANLALANNKIGELTKTKGDTRTALTFQQTARKIWGQLADEATDPPAKVEYQRNAARCDNTIGMLLADLGRPAEAIDVLAAAESTQAKLLEADSQSTDLAADLAATENGLGLALNKTGANDQAAKKLSQSVARLEKLQELLPKKEEVLRPLAAGYNNLGFIATKNQDWKSGEEYYRKSIGLYETLANSAPDSSLRRELAVSGNNLGMVQSREGHLADAESSFRKSLEIQQKLLTDQPQDIQTLSNLGGVYNNLGMLNDTRRRWSDADLDYQQAIRYQRFAFERAADSEAVRELLSKHYFNYSRNLREQHKPAEAADKALERKKLWPGNADRLYSVAQELTAACELMAAGPDADLAAQRKYGQNAVDTLRDAVAAGLPVERLRDESLKVLSDREDFRKMIAEARTEQANSGGSDQAQARQLN